MKNENGKVSITVGMLIGIIVVLLVVIECIVIYKRDYNEKSAEVSNKVSYTELSKENQTTNEDKNNFSNSMNDSNTNTLKNQITFNSLKGVYKGNIDNEFRLDSTEVRLVLCETGTFAYYYDPQTDCHYEGYYIFNETKIVLYNVLACGNDPAAVLNNDVIELTITKDGDIVDKTKLKTTLRKDTDNLKEVENVNISESLIDRFKNNFLEKGGSLNNNFSKIKISDTKYNSLNGIYKGNIDNEYGLDSTEVRLVLCETGTFAYYYDPQTDCHYEGYYIINDNKIILNSILVCGNDPAASLNDKTIELNINDDGTISDNVMLKTKFKKDLDEKIDDISIVDIAISIESRLKNNFLSVE